MYVLAFILLERKYCDMTPESRDSPLLENGSPKHVSAATDKLVEARVLLRNQHTFPRKEISTE
jgi:hypothetical protein